MINKEYLEKKPRKSKRGRVRKVSRRSIYQKYIDKYRQAECVLDKIRVYVKESKFQSEDTDSYEDEIEPKHDIENKNTIRTQILTDYQYCSCQSTHSCYLPQIDSYYSKTLFEHINYPQTKIEKTDTSQCQSFTLRNKLEHNYKPQIQIMKNSDGIEDHPFRNKELRIILERVQLHKLSQSYSQILT